MGERLEFLEVKLTEVPSERMVPFTNNSLNGQRQFDGRQDGKLTMNAVVRGKAVEEEQS